MIDLDKEKVEWKKFYDLRNSIYELILKNAEFLDDSSSKFYRWLCYIKDKDLLKKIDILIKEMNEQYKIASKEEKEYRETPIILNDVENIIINSYDSYSSQSIVKGTIMARLGLVKLSSIDILKQVWGENYNKNLKNYKLIENRRNNTVVIGFEDLLTLANARVIQERNFTGKRYTLNVRKTGENISTRYKYGIVLLDKRPNVVFANKEAKRKHSLDISGERVQFPFPVKLTCDLFIKEKLE